MDRPAALVAVAGLLLAPLVAWAATLQPKFALLGAIALAGALVLFRWPRLGAYALVAAYPFDALFVGVGFAQLGPADVMCMAVVPMWLLHRLAFPGGLRLPRGWVLLVLFLGLCFASMTLGVTPQRAHGVYLRTITYVLAAFVVVDLGRDAKFLHRALWIMVATGAVHTLFALPEIGRASRIEGLVGQSNILAHLLGISTMAALGLADMERTRWRRLGLLAAATLMLVIIALTISRGTYVAIGVCLIWWARRSRAQLVLAAVAVGAVILLSEGVNRIHVERIEARLRLEDGHSAVNRAATAQNALRAIEHHPLLGVGFGQFRDLDAAIQTTQQFDRSAHSFYLSVAASAGLPALLVLAAFVLPTARRLWRRRTAAERLPAEALDRSSILRSFQGILLFIAISLITKDDGKSRFWVTLGLVTAASMLALPRSAKDEEGAAQPAGAALASRR